MGHQVWESEHSYHTKLFGEVSTNETRLTRKPEVRKAQWRTSGQRGRPSRPSPWQTHEAQGSSCARSSFGVGRKPISQEVLEAAVCPLPGKGGFTLSALADNFSEPENPQRAITCSWCVSFSPSHPTPGKHTSLLL